MGAQLPASESVSRLEFSAIATLIILVIRIIVEQTASAHEFVNEGRPARIGGQCRSVFAVVEDRQAAPAGDDAIGDLDAQYHRPAAVRLTGIKDEVAETVRHDGSVMEGETLYNMRVMTDHHPSTGPNQGTGGPRLLDAGAVHEFVAPVDGYTHEDAGFAKYLNGVDHLLEFGAAIIGVLLAAQAHSDEGKGLSATRKSLDMEALTESAGLARTDDPDTGSNEVIHCILCSFVSVFEYMVIGEIGDCKIPIGQQVGRPAIPSHVDASQEAAIPALIGENAFHVTDDNIVFTKHLSNVGSQEIPAVLCKRRGDSAADIVERVPAHDIAKTSYADCAHYAITASGSRVFC